MSQSRLTPMADASLCKIATNLRILRQQLYSDQQARALLDESLETLCNINSTKPRSLGAKRDQLGLTGREVQVLELLVQGERPQFIANSLAISINTVRRHLAAIFKKLNVNSQVACIEKFREAL